MTDEPPILTPVAEYPMTPLAEESLKAVVAEADANVVDLARRMGPEVLIFLRDVMLNNWMKLGFDKPIAAANRLAAADLVRKYSAIPSNLDLNVKVPPIIRYVGDDHDALRGPREEAPVPQRVLPTVSITASRQAQDVGEEEPVEEEVWDEP